MGRKGNSYFYIIYLLSFLAAFGPFITDFYLPALPRITEDLSCSPSQAQMTLTMGLLGCGSGQIFVGPITDRFGRKYPLLGALLLFMLASYGCFATNDINMLLLYRFGQGIAGGICMVISRAIAVDLYRGHDLLKTYSIIGAITGIAPISAPLIGGILLYFLVWQDLFFGLLLLGVFLFVVSLPFKESLVTDRKVVLSPATLLSGYRTLLRDPLFLMYTGIQGCAHGVMFTYIAASPFIFQDYYGVTEFQYSLLFGANAMFIFLGSLFVARVVKVKIVLYRGCGALFVLSLLVSLCFVFKLSIWIVEPLLMSIMFSLGVLYPASTSLGMSVNPNHSGVAAAIFGSTSFLVGSIVSPLPGLGNMFLMTSAVMIFCSFLTWGCGVRINRLDKDANRANELVLHKE